MKRSRYLIFGAIVVSILLITVNCFAQRRKPDTATVKGHIMYTLLKPGDIPAIFEPEFISAVQADSFYYSDEPLIAVVDGDIAKGYSTWHLDEHEVVNDFINGKAIAVTW